jgi:uncharacterized protein (DUF1684 family)
VIEQSMPAMHVSCFLTMLQFQTNPSLINAEVCMSALTDFRKLKDDFFAKDENSPLTPEQKQAFTGLKYFPENSSLRFEIVCEEFPEKQLIEMQTSRGDSQPYSRFGKIKFLVESEPVELVIYHSDTGFFLPFVDSLSGKETYPAGRYLEPESLEKGKFLVDFNLGYNPYCAYNERWSCPLTPAENRLKVPIRAGEKMYHH